MTLRLMIVFCVFLVALPAFAGENGTADTTGQVRIVVPLRDIARGETITASDLGYQNAPESLARMGAVTAIADLDGMQARRSLRAGAPLRESDVRKPVLVAKGSTVTMVFQAPGITLTGMGRAMGEGGLGDVVVVLNPSSYRQMSATVTGPGTVRAEGLMANVPMANAAMTNAARAPRMAAAANRFSN